MSENLRRARALAGAGKLAEALAALPDTSADAQVLALRGALLSETGRPAEALEDFARALALDPANAATWSNQGNALAKLGRREEAIQGYDTALEHDPRYAPAQANRARMLFDLGQGLYHQRRFEEALDAIDRAIAAQTQQAVVHHLRAMILLNLRRREDALAAIDASLKINPDYEVQLSRAVILGALGRFAEGVAALDRAIAAQPGNPTGYFRRAQARLRLGDFPGGWSDYEHRWQAPSFLAGSRGFVTNEALTRLQPGLTRADVAGKAVLVIAEQGIGDQVMFASMLSDLAAEAASVACVCDARLQALFEASFPGISFIGRRRHGPLELAGYDVILPMGNLGRLYRQTPEDFPAAPYLRPRPQIAAAWSERLGPKTTPLRIGLSWRGGTASTDTAWRSLTLDDLRRLLTLQGCEFVSLQYGDTAAEVAAINPGLPRPIRLFAPAEIDDFEDLAGLVQSLDLVVSVQTALIHLCGAVGAPCLVMTPFMPEWRYSVAGETMPWYGSVKLLRQSAPDDWAPVIAAVAAELEIAR